MTANEVIAELNVTSTALAPEEFSARVKLQPTKTWRAGEAIGKSTRRYERNGWSLASRKVTEVEDAIAELIATLDTRWRELKEATDGCDVELSLVIYARAYVPAISIAPEHIRRLAELHARVDVDFYDLVESDGGT